ncbi:MAG: M24 family metallopeptidase [Alphaproteobacteria bacterium]
MALHFTREEFARRQKATIKELARRDLHGMLMFRQESMYYLTGYETFGYCFFQCLYLGADGRLTLLTRLPDTFVARQTSIIKDIRIWTNLPDANPSMDLRRILEEHGCRGKRLGIELDAYGLTGAIYRRVMAALTDFVNLEDVSDLVSKQRVIKSPAEMVYARKAGRLADAALVEANRLAVPGADEGEILAAMQGAVFKGGGEYPGNEFIIGSGKKALLGRHTSGRLRLKRKDQLTIEWAGTYRRYHAAMMRTILTGKPSKRHVDMHKAAVDAHWASAAQIRPGRTFGDVFDAYARSLDRRGHRKHRVSATGYSMGTTFTPTWMDWPMFWHGNPVVIEPGMVLFLHTLVFDERRWLAMAPGQSYEVTARGNKSLSRMPLDLVVNG